MSEYGYSAYITVRASNDQEVAERISEAQGLLARMTTVTLKVVWDDALADEIKAALEGDSNDAEHDALASVAASFGIEYRDPDDVLEEDEA